MNDSHSELPERECPNCGGVMYGHSDDEYCIDCIHNGRA
jgi:ribosomal protein S27AE